MRTPPTSGNFTPLLTAFMWANFKRRTFKNRAELIKHWCDNGIAHYVIDTPMSTDTIATRFREVGGRFVSVRYIGKARLSVAISHYEE